MANTSARVPQRPRRSRNGCEECRRRHWKCNEEKPVCSYCKSVGRECIYSRKISWGGRPFNKSRFGKCFDSASRVVTVSFSNNNSPPAKRTEFVYTCSSPEARHGQRNDNTTSQSPSSLSATRSSPAPSSSQSPRPDEADVGSRNATRATKSASPDSCHDIEQPLSIVQSLPQESKPLFDYFINRMTISISCHKGIQDDLCSTVVPMALQVPHLLSAVLALASAHRQSCGLVQGDGQFDLMRGKTLKQLRSALDSFKPTENDEILATTLILCMAEVVSPYSGTTSWRSHLQGAAVLSARQGSGQSSNATFLRRKFQALQAMALVCGTKRYEGHVQPPSLSETDGRIDDLAGYSTKLLPIFQSIHDLGMLQPEDGSLFSCDSPPGLPHWGCSSQLEHQSHLLFDRVRELMLEREQSRSSDLSSLPQAIRHDLWLLDEAYHHMAILQIFQRGSLSVPHQFLEDSRSAILNCLGRMSYHSTPCPGVAVLPPLFVAGALCTSTADQNQVLSLLRTLWVNYGMANVRSCRSILESRWKRQGQTLGSTVELTGPAWQDDEHDVLPY